MNARTILNIESRLKQFRKTRRYLQKRLKNAEQFDMDWLNQKLERNAAIIADLKLDLKRATIFKLIPGGKNPCFPSHQSTARLVAL